MLTAPVENSFFLFTASIEKSTDFKPKNELEFRWLQMLPYLDVNLLDPDQ